MMRGNAIRFRDRRGFLKTLGFAMMPLGGCRRQSAAEHGTDGCYEWSGIGFGIGMRMELHGIDASLGERLGQRCQEEIALLEQAFSLYLEDSELRRLNRERELAKPTPVFGDLLDKAISLEQRTLGFYQPAIHGAWEWLADHGYRIEPAHLEEWRRQCEAADSRHIEMTADGGIRLTHPLTRLSMNAVGQGYLADRVANFMRAAGVRSGLLNLGETYAIGQHPEHRFWKLAVTGTAHRGEVDLVGEIEFADAGLAVSANEASRILIDPVGRRLQQHDRVAAVVTGEGATVADAFATAFAVAPRERWETLTESIQRGGQAQVKVWEENRLAYSG